MRRSLVYLLGATAATTACGGSGDKPTEVFPPTEVRATAGSTNGLPGLVVAIPPSVTVTDARATPVPNFAVTFAVTSGGGTITGASQVTNASGVATLGSWTLGTASGANTVTATATGLSGSPVAFVIQATNFFTSVEAAEAYTCALTTSGAAYCWGKNAGGMLGDGTTTERFSPVLVQGGFRFTSISARMSHTCGLISTGAAYCWGTNTYGGLGDNTTTNHSVPTPVQTTLAFTSISAGGGHTCALTSAGAAYCWGQNSDGELGDGSNLPRLTPVAVQGGLTFASINVGRAQSTCAVTTAGAAYCWGRADFGELGNGNTDNKLLPTPVSGGLVFTNVSGGFYHTCGRTSSGAGYCWGDNSLFAVGDSTSFNRAVPVPVAGGLSLASITAGGYHSCGLTTAGAAYCWGDNGTISQGALGDNTVVNRPTPVAVQGGLVFTALSAGHEHTCGLTAAGTIYCWGTNISGELGDGTATLRLVPVPSIRP